jgi:hypothetical protein
LKMLKTQLNKLFVKNKELNKVDPSSPELTPSGEEISSWLHSIPNK